MLAAGMMALLVINLFLDITCWITGMLTSLLASPEQALSAVCSWGHPPLLVTNVDSAIGSVYSCIKVCNLTLANLSLKMIGPL
jgi:hypothetical protein